MAWVSPFAGHGSVPPRRGRERGAEARSPHALRIGQRRECRALVLPRERSAASTSGQEGTVGGREHRFARCACASVPFGPLGHRDGVGDLGRLAQHRVNVSGNAGREIIGRHDGTRGTRARAIQETETNQASLEELTDVAPRAEDVEKEDGGKASGKSATRKGKRAPASKKKKSNGQGGKALSLATQSNLNLVRAEVEKELGEAIPEYLLPQLSIFATFEVDVPELVKLTKMQLVSKDRKGKVLKIPEHILSARLGWYNDCFDLTGKELGKALTRDPRILQCSPETTTAKRVQYLQRRGMDKQQLTKVFRKSPQFFRLDVTKSMEPRFQFLEQLGIPKSLHPSLLVKDPAIMNRSISTMEENALFLLEIGFDPQSLQLVLVKHPSLLRYNRKSMKKVVYFFSKLGITQNERVVLISRLPQVFSMSLERNLMAKFSYFLRTLGWSVHDLSMSPQVLSLSLKGRILGRHQFLVHKGSFEYFKDFKRRRWLLVTDQVFATSIAKCPLEEYQAFLKKFLKKTKSAGTAAGGSGGRGKKK